MCGGSRVMILPFPIPSRDRRRALVRHVIPVIFSGLLCAAQLGAQDSTGAVSGKVIDATTQQALPSVEVAIAGTPHRMLTRTDGGLLLRCLPAGLRRPPA